MIIAVVAVRVMQVAVNQVVDVVAMRDRLMSTTGSVDVSSVVTGSRMSGGALVGIRCIDRQHVFINMIAVDMVQVAIMQIIGMAFMIDRHVTAPRTVLVVVV